MHYDLLFRIELKWQSLGNLSKGYRSNSKQWFDWNKITSKIKATNRSLVMGWFRKLNTCKWASLFASDTKCGLRHKEPIHQYFQSNLRYLE